LDDDDGGAADEMCEMAAKVDEPEIVCREGGERSLG